MRILVASLFVVGLMEAAVGVLSLVGVEGRVHPVVLGLGMGVLFLALCVAALVLFNPRWADPLGCKSDDQLPSDLDDGGLVVSTDFRARRASEMAAIDDAGPHYFLELDDGRVLYLGGRDAN